MARNSDLYIRCLYVKHTNVDTMLSNAFEVIKDPGIVKHLNEQDIEEFKHDIKKVKEYIDEITGETIQFLEKTIP